MWLLKFLSHTREGWKAFRPRIQ